MTGERWTEAMLDGLATSVAELREGQALLVQIVTEDKQSASEFRRTTNSALDRIESVINRLADGQERHQIMLERHQMMLERHQMTIERHQVTIERIESLAESLAAGQERQERLLDYLMQRDRDRS